MRHFKLLYNFFSNLFYKLPDSVTRHKRYFKACISGVISLGLQLVAFNLLRLWIKPTIAVNISVEIAILCNFAINSFFTFGDKKHHNPGLKTALTKLVKFNAVSLSSMLIQYLCVHAELALFGRHLILENTAMLIGIIIGSIVNFILYKYVVWRH